MTDAKICGVGDREALEAAIAGRARWVGLMFYPPSPRFIDERAATELSRLSAGRIERVGVFVEPDDATLRATLAAVPLDWIQLHGKETPARVVEVKAMTGLPVIKAVAIAEAGDAEAALAYAEAADMLLFDAKPPKGHKDALPGGNAISFDWTLIAGRSWPLPWLLSGGLHPGNVAEAVRLASAPAVDVSSGVESAPGTKDPERIRAFLSALGA